MRAALLLGGMALLLGYGPMGAVALADTLLLEGGETLEGLVLRHDTDTGTLVIRRLDGSFSTLKTSRVLRITRKAVREGQMLSAEGRVVSLLLPRHTLPVEVSVRPGISRRQVGRGTLELSRSPEGEMEWSRDLLLVGPTGAIYLRQQVGLDGQGRPARLSFELEGGLVPMTLSGQVVGDDFVCQIGNSVLTAPVDELWHEPLAVAELFRRWSLDPEGSHPPRLIRVVEPWRRITDLRELSLHPIEEWWNPAQQCRQSVLVVRCTDPWSGRILRRYYLDAAGDPLTYPLLRLEEVGGLTLQVTPRE